VKLGATARRRGAIMTVWVVALLAAAVPAHAQTSTAHDPVIFVHGYSGSGAQFESQKLRFVENGYPDSYVTVLEYDSTPATPVPGGVPTLALWGSKGPLSPPGRSITGATNVTIPDSPHVQTATSPLSFAEMYKFFNGGSAPATTDIVPESGRITLSGKALLFPN